MGSDDRQNRESRTRRTLRWVALTVAVIFALLAIARYTARSAPVPGDGSAAGSSDWSVAQPDYQWLFPRDHWSHPGYKVEWWYFTGQVESSTEAGRRFGFQLTFFRVGMTPQQPPFASRWAANDLVMGHAAITDLGAGEHVFSEVLYRAVPLLGGFGTFPDQVLAWSRGPAGTEGLWQLGYADSAFSLQARDDRRGLVLDLDLRPARPLIFEGPGGYSRKSDRQQADGRDTAASMYYSYPRLAVTGTLGRSPETAHQVTGSAWMDHEFSTSQLEDEQVGWDWFSLQLEDGRDLMLYRMRRQDGGVDFALGTLVSADGAVRYLSAADFSLQPRRRWKSEISNAEYPVVWDLTVPQAELQLRIRALLDAQENVSRRSGVHYWEGAVEAVDDAGVLHGRGYVELTGYGEGSRPPI